jgi:hypothetical protein
MDTGTNVLFKELLDERHRTLVEQNVAILKKCDEMAASIVESRREIVARQDKTNGRVQASEVALAVLKVGYVIGGVILAGVAAYFFNRLP